MVEAAADMDEVAADMDDSTEDEHMDSDTEKLFDEWDVQASDYIRVDDDVATSEIPKSATCAEDITPSTSAAQKSTEPIGEDSDGEEDFGGETEKVSRQTVLECMRKINTYCLQAEGSHKLLNAFNAFVQVVEQHFVFTGRQKKMTDFFSMKDQSKKTQQAKTGTSRQELMRDGVMTDNGNTEKKGGGDKKDGGRNTEGTTENRAKNDMKGKGDKRGGGDEHTRSWDRQKRQNERSVEGDDAEAERGYEGMRTEQGEVSEGEGSEGRLKESDDEEERENEGLRERESEEDERMDEGMTGAEEKDLLLLLLGLYKRPSSRCRDKEQPRVKREEGYVVKRLDFHSVKKCPPSHSSWTSTSQLSLKWETMTP